MNIPQLLTTVVTSVGARPKTYVFNEVEAMDSFHAVIDCIEKCRNEVDECTRECWTNCAGSMWSNVGKVECFNECKSGCSREYEYCLELCRSFYERP